jgi:hypothetical protein
MIKIKRILMALCIALLGLSIFFGLYLLCVAYWDEVRNFALILGLAGVICFLIILVMKKKLIKHKSSIFCSVSSLIIGIISLPPVLISVYNILERFFMDLYIGEYFLMTTATLFAGLAFGLRGNIISKGIGQRVLSMFGVI